MSEGPLAALDFELFRTGQLQQVAYRRAKHAIIAFEKVVVFSESSECARNIGGDGRLFGDDQLLAHGVFSNPGCGKHYDFGITA